MAALDKPPLGSSRTQGGEERSFSRAVDGGVLAALIDAFAASIATTSFAQSTSGGGAGSESVSGAQKGTSGANPSNGGTNNGQ